MKKRRKLARRRDQLAEQWEEEQKLKGVVERRRIDGMLLEFGCHSKKYPSWW